MIQQSGGTMMRTKPNLHCALRYLRKENEDRIVWIDAIWINQSDEDEKSDQIAHMRGIYQNAEQVLFWLGQADETTDRIMDTIAALHVEACINYPDWKEPGKRLAIAGPLFRQRLEYASTDEHCKQLSALRALLQRPWFQRVWIVQEVASARAATVLCGSKSIPAYVFAIIPSLLGLEVDKHTQAVLDIMPGQLRRQSWWTDRCDLHFLLDKFAGCQASDPKDKIFAILGISSDAFNSESFPLDYRKTLQQVYRDTLCFLLFKRVVPSSIIKLPSLALAVLIQHLDDMPRLAELVIQWAVKERHDLTSAFMLETTGYTAVNLTVDNLMNHGGHFLLMKYLFSKGQVDELSENSRGERLLNTASRKGNEQMVCLLLERPQTAINHKDSDGLTPLGIATIHEHLPIVQILLCQKDVILSDGGPLGTAPISIALMQGNWPMALHIGLARPSQVAEEEFLVGRRLVEVSRALLAIMARDDYVAGLKSLVRRGVNYDGRDVYGISPLMRAAGNGSLSTMKLLMLENSHGYVNVDGYDLSGRTALSHAAERGQLDACHLLMLGGADIGLVGNNGKSPRNWAEDKDALEKTWSQLIAVLRSSGMHDIINTHVHAKRDNDSGKVVEIGWNKVAEVPGEGR